MQGGRGVKIVIFMALRCKVMENTRKTEGAWGKSFSGPPRGPEEQRTYEQRTRLAEHAVDLTEAKWRSKLKHDVTDKIERVFILIRRS
jgi:hypothetical protein